MILCLNQRVADSIDEDILYQVYYSEGPSQVPAIKANQQKDYDYVETLDYDSTF